MKFLEHKFLFAPFVLLAAGLLLDKLFLLPPVLDRTVSWKRIEPPLYESREWLFESLVKKNEKESFRPALVLGTSRSAMFSHADFARHYPDIVVYNFSAPFASYSFHDYWLEKIIQAKVDLRFIILEADPVLFGPGSNEYSLAYTFDAPFVLQHTDLDRDKHSRWDLAEGNGFSFEEAETFFLKRLFALYRYPLDFNSIKENSKSFLYLSETGAPVTIGRIEFKKRMLEAMRKEIETNPAGIPQLAQRHGKLTPDQLKADTETKFNDFQLNRYSPSRTQTIFLKKIIRTAAAHSIPILLYLPPSTPYFRSKMEEAGILGNVVEALRGIVARETAANPKATIKFIDPATQMKCAEFYDSLHMSGVCYPELTDILLAQVKESVR